MTRKPRTQAIYKNRTFPNAPENPSKYFHFRDRMHDYPPTVEAQSYMKPDDPHGPETKTPGINENHTCRNAPEYLTKM